MLQTCRTPESRQPPLLCSLSAVSSTRMLPRKPPEFSSSSSSIDRFQPLRRESSRPTGDALLPPPADDCLFPGVNAPNIVGHCKPFPGSEYPSSLRRSGLRIRCFRPDQLSGYLRHCRRDHLPLHQSEPRPGTHRSPEPDYTVFRSPYFGGKGPPRSCSTEL